MENRKIQFRSKACNLHLSAYPGHFATKQDGVYDSLLKALQKYSDRDQIGRAHV